MSKQEEIEEISRVLYDKLWGLTPEDCDKVAGILYNADYRKAPELEARIRELEGRWEKLEKWVGEQRDSCTAYGILINRQSVLDKMTELMGGQEDVCEWTWKEYDYQSSCGYAYITEDKLKFKNCPHCHKPIKIKEGE